MDILALKRVEVDPEEQVWLRTPLEEGRACIYAGVCMATRKIYVGQHLSDKGKRKRSCWDRRIVVKKKEKKCIAMYNAIQKHGFDSFEWFILAECAAYYVNNLEKTFIRWCDSLSPKGYNIRDGGARGRLHADSIAKMKASLPFEKRSVVSKEVANRPEVKEALRKRMKGSKRTYTINPANEAIRRDKISKANKGKHVTVESRARISAAAKKGWEKRRR